jgi:hypothetical protein
MERAWGERAKEHAAEVAYQFWRGATASGPERGVDYAVAAADNAEAAYAFDEVATFLRIVIDLLPRNAPRQPRLLARRGLALTWTLEDEEAVKVALRRQHLSPRRKIMSAPRRISRTQPARCCARVSRNMRGTGQGRPALHRRSPGHGLGEPR